jgi:hypothetical protein
MKAKGKRGKAKEESAVPALTSVLRLAAMILAITDSGD